MKWFIFSQSFAMMASAVSFPFYLLFIQNIGSNFTSFGFAYGLFTLSSALFHRVIGKGIDRFGGKGFLVGYAWGMSILFLFIPFITSIWLVYLFQIALGFFGAMQKTCEKSMISELSEGEMRGTAIGNYHFWTTLCSALAVMGTGIVLDYFTIHVIFYICSVFYLISGVILQVTTYKKLDLSQ
jgi:MFS family permease